MPAFQINDDEREALRGLPMLAREAYVFGLRPFMDYATGVVGIKRGVSWKSIAEELYVEPHQGIESGEPSEKQLRRAIVWLQKVGLLSDNRGERRLIFELLRASRDQSARNKEGSKRADQAGRPSNIAQPSNGAPLERATPLKVAGGEIEKAGTPPESGFLPTSRHPAREPPDRFPMHDNWEPTSNGWKATALRNGLGSAFASQELLMEFRSYWINRPDKYQSQGQWEHELAQKLKREVRNAQRPGYSQAETHQDGTGGKRHVRQRSLSAPDRVRLAIEQQRADRAKACGSAANGAAGETMGNHVGDLRAPLDVEFWREPEA